MKKIIFSDQTPVAYRGRNGMGKMSGIEIHQVPAGYTSLNPITSKGAASDAAVLEVPNGETLAVCAAILEVEQKMLWAMYCMLKGAAVNYNTKSGVRNCKILDVSANDTATVIFNDETKLIVWVKHLSPI